MTLNVWPSFAWGCSMPYHDGEVLGLDADGCVIQWDADRGAAYNSGETLEEFGADNLRAHERGRLGL